MKAALDRFPRTTFAIARTRIVWRTVEKLVRGEIDDVGGARGLVRRSRPSPPSPPRGRAAPGWA